VLLKLGEIVLKGKNRQQFERLLQNNIRLAAADLGLGIRLWQRDGVIVLSPAPASSPDPAPPPDRGQADGHAETADRLEAAQVAADQIAERMLNVMGVVRVCRAVRVTKEASAAIETATELAGGRPGAFAVRARRRDKRFP
jgi:thiamine biosynthesis protein ThiI